MLAHSILVGTATGTLIGFVSYTVIHTVAMDANNILSPTLEGIAYLSGVTCVVMGATAGIVLGVVGRGCAYFSPV
jgi:hypothetical protein